MFSRSVIRATRHGHRTTTDRTRDGARRADSTEENLCRALGRRVARLSARLQEARGA